MLCLWGVTLPSVETSALREFLSRALKLRLVQHYGSDAFAVAECKIEATYV